jgi:hypothetical protein
VLVAVVGIAALTNVWRRGARWPVVACAALCPLGLLGYWAYVANLAGELGGWFTIEREGWGWAFDGGLGTLKFVGGVLASGSSVMETVTVFIVLAAVALAVLTARCRVPWPIVAYGAGMVVTVAGSMGLDFAKPRSLLPAFTLLIPVAIGLANRKRTTMIAVTVIFVLLGGWFSAYALTGWEYAI